MFVIFLLCSIWQTLQPTSNFDLWWVLKTGQVIIQTRSLPPHDLFSFTAGTTRWVHHAWLAAVIFYYLYKVGGFTLLFVLKTLLILTSFLLAFRIGLKKTKGNTSAAALSGIWMLFSSTMLQAIGIRSLLFSFVFFTVTWTILEDAYDSGKTYLLYLIIPLSLLWVNTHTSFILCFMLQLAYLLFYKSHLKLLKILKKYFFPGQDSSAEACNFYAPVIKTAIIVLAASFATSCINPEGIRMFIMPFSSLDNKFVSNIAEFAPPQYFSAQLSFTLTVTSILIFSIALRKKFRTVDFVLLFAFALLGMKAIRHMFYFSIYALPAGAVILDSAGKLFIEKTRNFKEIYYKMQVPLSIILFIVLMPVSYYFFSGINLRDLNKEWGIMPVGGVEFLKKNKIPGRMFNPYEWGGYFIWNLYPEYKVMIDGRGGVVYPEEVFVEQNHAAYGGPQWKLIMDKYKINYVITNKNMDSRFGRKLTEQLRKDSGWTLIYEDIVEVIFIKNVPQNSELIEKSKTSKLIIPETPYSLEKQAAAMLTLGYPDKCEELLNKALAIYPEFAPALFRVAKIKFEKHDYAGAAENMKKILKISPRTAGLNFNIGLIYEMSGDKKNALKYYKAELKLYPGDQKTIDKVNMLSAK